VGVVQGVQHGTDPTCKMLNRFKFLYVFREVRIPNSSCIFKIGVTYRCFRVSISEYL